jgi:hypothetical protein
MTGGFRAIAIHLGTCYTIGYTYNYEGIMKAAISIDDQIYRTAEYAAGQLGLTRSRLYTLAMEEYVRNIAPIPCLNGSTRSIPVKIGDSQTG